MNTNVMATTYLGALPYSPMARRALLPVLVLAAAFASGCGVAVESGGASDEDAALDDWCLNQDDGAYCPVCDLKGACQGGTCVQVQLGPPHCD